MGFWHFRDGLLRVLPMRLMVDMMMAAM